MKNLKNRVIEFLRKRDILKNEATHFVITFENGSKVDVVDLLIDFSREDLNNNNEELTIPKRR